MAPIAAKHGAHNKLNTRNEKPAATHVLAPNDVAMFEIALASSVVYKIPRVATIFSFATKPVTAPTAACQFPHPNGAKIQAIPLPIAARYSYPSDLLLTSDNVHLRNQSMISTKLRL